LRLPKILVRKLVAMRTDPPRAPEGTPDGQKLD